MLFDRLATDRDVSAEDRRRLVGMLTASASCPVDTERRGEAECGRMGDDDRADVDVRLLTELENVSIWRRFSWNAVLNCSQIALDLNWKVCCVWESVLCCVVLCCVVLRCVVLCCAVLCCAVLCCVVLCCVVLCCAVLCCAVLCCAVLCVVLCWFLM